MNTETRQKMVNFRIREAAENCKDSLDLSRMNLRDTLEIDLSSLGELKRLDLSHNHLTEIPKSVFNLKLLEHLDVSKNHIRDLSSEIGSLTELRTFFAYGNRLDDIPGSLQLLQNLEELKLHNNFLKILPKELGALGRLRSLYVNHNILSDLPTSLGRLKRLSLIMLAGNPLSDTLKTTASRGIDDLLSYLRSLEDDTELLSEAKLILVGEGGVGKTSLVCALNGGKFVENRETTHGIEMCRFGVFHPKTGNIALNVWDFGGQPVYRVTHQFFYSKRSLYLLLWSPRRGVELSDVEGWIKRIKLRIGDSAKIIIVATHSQTGGRVARIDKDELSKTYGDIIVGFHEVDSMTLHGINTLKEIIAEAASKLPQMGSLFSLKWKAARDLVLADGGPRIAYVQFSRLCYAKGLDIVATRTLADLMHDLGYVVYYGDDDGLAMEMILKPEWLSKAIGFVLEDRETNEQRGVLDHYRLRKIWFDHGDAGRECYPVELHRYFLRLMEKYDASYRLEGGVTSLVSQLVPNVRPELPWDIDAAIPKDDVQVRLVCQMEDDPPGLIPWLIVRTHHFSTRPRLHWQRGMFLRYGSHGDAIIEQRGRELQISVRAAWPNYFLEVIRYIVVRLMNERWPGLDATFAVPCPRTVASGGPCKGRFPLDTLHKLKSKFDSIPCMVCSEESPIEQLLTGFTPPTERQLFGTLETQLRLTRAQLGKIESENASRFRSTLRALNEETRECPHIFTLLPSDLITRKVMIGHEEYCLTLWCEMPGCQHPVCAIGSGGSGEYVFSRSAEWLRRIAPYVSFVARVLKTVIPIAGSVIKAATDEITCRDLVSKIEIMEKITTTMIKDEGVVRSVAGGLGIGTVSYAEGASLRELHSLLMELDPEKRWGGLKRAISPTGEYLWLCQDHFLKYEPGLPAIPYDKCE